MEYFAPRVNAKHEKETIVWEKKTETIRIPKTRHHTMARLINIWSKVQKKHAGETFTLSKEDNLAIFSQEEWCKIPYERRRELFATSNVLVVHDKSPNKYHPHPIMPDIKDWKRSQISQHFNLMEVRYVQEQSWFPNRAFEQATMGRWERPISRMQLVDDGTKTAVQAMLNEPLERPRRVEPRKEGSLWRDTFLYPTGGTAQPKETATEAEIRNVPDLLFRVGTLDQLLHNVNRPDVKKGTRRHGIVNFLDLPLSHDHSFSLPISGLSPFPDLSSIKDPRHMFASDIPHVDFKWGLAASKDAISTTHMDAAGFCTWIRTILGRKLWFIGTPSSTQPHMTIVDSQQEELVREAAGALRKCIRAKRSLKKGDILNNSPRERTDMVNGNKAFPYISITDGYVDSAMEWTLVVLNPGDDLCVPLAYFSCCFSSNEEEIRRFMQPGTPHFVISLDNCLAVGGHFLCPSTMDRTLSALTIEHFVGTLVTNTNHASCGIVFIRMLSYVCDVMRREKLYGGKGGDPIWRPTDKEIAVIVVIVSYLDQLAPEATRDLTTADDTDSEEEGIVELKEVKESRHSARQAWKEMMAGLGEDDPPAVVIKGQRVTINNHSFPQVWQETDAFKHDFQFAIHTLVPNLVGSLANEAMLDEICIAEDTLLQYSEHFVLQKKAVLQYGKPIKPSSALRSALSRARKAKNMPEIPLQLDAEASRRSQMAKEGAKLNEVLRKRYTDGVLQLERTGEEEDPIFEEDRDAQPMEVDTPPETSTNKGPASGANSQAKDIEMDKEPGDVNNAQQSNKRKRKAQHGGNRKNGKRRKQN